MAAREYTSLNGSYLSSGVRGAVHIYELEPIMEPSPSMRRPVSVKSVFCFSLLGDFFFPLSRVASVAILPSALCCERFSLGASWVSSIQQVLLPVNGPRLSSFRPELGQLRSIRGQYVAVFIRVDKF
jgi:hypothetical protein